MTATEKLIHELRAALAEAVAPPRPARSVTDMRHSVLAAIYMVRMFSLVTPRPDALTALLLMEMRVKHTPDALVPVEMDGWWHELAHHMTDAPVAGSA